MTQNNRVVWARVFDNQVTHIIRSRRNWIDLNPWPDVPGEWIEAPMDVKLHWIYSSETNTFSPPAVS